MRAARVNLFSEKSVGWISVAHPPFRACTVDAPRLSTLRFFKIGRWVKIIHPLIHKTNLREQIYPARATEQSHLSIKTAAYLAYPIDYSMSTLLNH
ncbi:MAG: hypothetical protein HZC43_06520 [Nitrosomonadales bacterium]|nr:hypothetical protein [Nitrosomonadales bacterium]